MDSPDVGRVMTDEELFDYLKKAFEFSMQLPETQKRREKVVDEKMSDQEVRACLGKISKLLTEANERRKKEIKARGGNFFMDFFSIYFADDDDDCRKSDSEILRMNHEYALALADAIWHYRESRR